MRTTITVTRVSNGFIFEGKNQRKVFATGESAAEDLIQDLSRTLISLDVDRPQIITIELEPVAYAAKGN
jgi:hypothetical protein